MREWTEISLLCSAFLKHHRITRVSDEKCYEILTGNALERGRKWGRFGDALSKTLSTLFHETRKEI